MGSYGGMMQYLHLNTRGFTMGDDIMNTSKYSDPLVQFCISQFYSSELNMGLESNFMILGFIEY
jgi:hypothetical protein